VLDVRLPIGALFFIIGLMIAIWGYTHTNVPAMITSFGATPINFDIIWGIFMTLFGIVMFCLAKLDHAVAAEGNLAKVKEAAQKEAPAEVTAEASEKSD
jgi:hypothetical protein